MVGIQEYKGEEHGESIVSLWNTIFLSYQIPRDHLLRLLNDRNGHHYVSLAEDGNVVAAAIAFKVGKTGYLSAVMTSVPYRRRGLASALVETIRLQLLKKQGCESFEIGSVFPRFWCGVPTEFLDDTHQFFRRLRFSPSSDKPAKDLCLDLDGYVPPSEALTRAAGEGLSFGPWTEDGYEECMRRQRANFDNAGWVGAYETLAREGLHRQVMVARDRDGSQVGWTLMIEPKLPVWNDLAFPQLLGEKTALIACVGVDSTARRRGVGHALVSHALLHLQSRGMEHVFVDWVVLDTWYERLGFKTWNSYQPMKWHAQV